MRGQQNGGQPAQCHRGALGHFDCAAVALVIAGETGLYGGLSSRLLESSSSTRPRTTSFCALPVGCGTPSPTRR